MAPASETSDDSGHLDATEREVVFCHACSAEWYRDDHGLECPFCESDVTELVSLENDPRRSGDHDELSSTPSPSTDRFDFNEDSDPEEADIDEHTDANGFSHRTSTRAGDGIPHHNATHQATVERFLGLLSTINVPRRGDGNIFRTLHDAAQGGHEHVHSTIWRTGGSTSVTFYTSWPLGEEGHATAGNFEPFQTMFSSVLRDLSGPIDIQPGNRQPGGSQPGGGQTQGLAGSLGDLLNFFHGVHGDGVYTQEALDRIITSMMDANPQSNAAPPATAEGLAKLPRKTIDDDLRSEDGNTDCSICIEAMKVGEVAVSLPCKHSFHEECALLWLKEHNTCPICRASIEVSPRNSGNGRPSPSSRPPRQQHRQEDEPHRDADQLPSVRRRASDTAADRAAASPARAMDAINPDMTLQVIANLPLAVAAATPAAASGSPSPAQQWAGMQSASPSGSSRPPNQGQTRLNQAMRMYLSSQHEERERDRSRGVSTGFSYDTSRLQRRNSHSPISPRVAAGDVERSMRERSPSQSSRRASPHGREEQHNNNSGGAMGWLRGRFIGGGGRG